MSAPVLDRPRSHAFDLRAYVLSQGLSPEALERSSEYRRAVTLANPLLFALLEPNHYSMGECKEAGCGRNGRLVRGWCNTHYQRWRAHGDPSVKLTLKGEPLRVRFEAQVDRSAGPEGCHPWKNPGSAGYGMVRVGGVHKGAHVVSWFLETGEWPSEDVLHSCDNPPCCNFAHLSVGSHTENMHQMFERGRANKATEEGHPGAKLTLAAVEEAVLLREQGWKLRDLAERYGVSISSVGRALQGKTWKSVSGSYQPSFKRAR